MSKVKALKGYNRREVITNSFIEIWEYSENVIYAVNIGDEEDKRKKDDKKNNEDDVIINKKSTADYYEALRKREKYYENKRWEICRLIDCNYNFKEENKTKFVTLTFKDNIDDIDTANKEFSNFLKRLNDFLFGRKSKMQLKYVATNERQKRGAVHYHVVFFDLNYIPNKKLSEIWRNGFVKVNSVKNVDSPENIARYVSKYFSKDLEEKDWKKKAYFKSQNLNLPVERKTLQEKEDFSNNRNVVYSKEYSRAVPDFFTPTTTGELMFKESLVRYTKIRRENTNYDNKKGIN